MKEYTIVKRPDDFSWDKIPTLDICEPLEDHAPLTIRSTAQICYDDKALYVRLATDEKEIRAELFGPLDEVCCDSCMEFFFSPKIGDRRYINIEGNFNKATFLGLGSNVHTLVRLIPEENPIQTRPAKTEDGWELCYEIPYEFIRRFFPDFAPFSGMEMRANCYKCADATEPPHYFTWNPTPYNPVAAFHNPDAFGLMRFE